MHDSVFCNNQLPEHSAIVPPTKDGPECHSWHSIRNCYFIGRPTESKVKVTSDTRPRQVQRQMASNSIERKVTEVKDVVSNKLQMFKLIISAKSLRLPVPLISARKS